MHNTSFQDPREGKSQKIILTPITIASKYDNLNIVRSDEQLPLLLADRIGVVEGIIDDFKSGHIPNIFAEKGWKAAWKYNPKGFFKSALLGAVISVSVVAILRKSK